MKLIVILMFWIAVGTAIEMSWTQYHNLDTIYGWMASLSTQYPNEATMINISKSFENRNISGIHVHTSKAINRKAVFLEANMHAREWITSAVTTFILNQFLTSSHPRLKKLTDMYDWYIFPITNPDGFDHSHKDPEFRQWKKTRQVLDGECKGVDPNLNWEFNFNKFGTSSDTCDNLYPGSAAFSAPETKALSQFLEKEIGIRLEAYISFHSNRTAKILIPYGTGELANNFPELFEIALHAANGMAEIHGTSCVTENYAKLKNKTSGGSVDWVKKKLNPRLSFTYEIRDGIKYDLPANEIIPTAEETINSLVVMFETYEKIKNSAGRTSIKYLSMIASFIIFNLIGAVNL